MRKITFFRVEKGMVKALNKPLSILLSILVVTSFTATVFSSTDYFTYDSNGNMIRDTSRGQCYEYNDAHRLKKVTDCGGNTIAEYWYDHTGRKIKAVEGDLTILYPFPDYEERVSGGVRNTSMYVRLNGEIVARIDIDPYGNNRTYYYHGDHLGSTSLITNESGDVVENTGYLPYGGLKTGGEQSGTHLYTGKELNPSTGLYYYEHRDYDPGIPKFLEPDPVIQDPYDPQTLNRYSYVRNNPIKYTDPSGNYLESAFDVGFILWDIHDISQDPGNVWNWGALVVDVGCLALPIVTGGGRLVKAVEHGEDIGKLVNKGLDALTGVDKASDAAKVIRANREAGKAGEMVVKNYLEKKLGKEVVAYQVTREGKRFDFLVSGTDVFEVKNINWAAETYKKESAVTSRISAIKEQLMGYKYILQEGETLTLVITKPSNIKTQKAITNMATEVGANVRWLEDMA